MPTDEPSTLPRPCSFCGKESAANSLMEGPGGLCICHLCVRRATEAIRLRNAYCSFCCKAHTEVGPLVEGPNWVYICYKCIQIVRRSKAREVPGGEMIERDQECSPTASSFRTSDPLSAAAIQTARHHPHTLAPRLRSDRLSTRAFRRPASGSHGSSHVGKPRVATIAGQSASSSCRWSSSAGCCEAVRISGTTAVHRRN
jgi:hypothetical protein